MSSFFGSNRYHRSLQELQETSGQQWRIEVSSKLLGINESVELGGDGCLASVCHESSRCRKNHGSLSIGRVWGFTPMPTWVPGNSGVKIKGL